MPVAMARCEQIPFTIIINDDILFPWTVAADRRTVQLAWARASSVCFARGRSPMATIVTEKQVKCERNITKQSEIHEEWSYVFKFKSISCVLKSKLFIDDVPGMCFDFVRMQFGRNASNESDQRLIYQSAINLICFSNFSLLCSLPLKMKCWWI